MKLNFKSIKTAREYLIDAGYAFAKTSVTNRGRDRSEAEIFEAPGMIAVLRKLPFRGVSVRITPAA